MVILHITGMLTLSGSVHCHGLSYHWLLSHFIDTQKSPQSPSPTCQPSVQTQLSEAPLLETQKTWSQTSYSNSTMSGIKAKIPQGQVYWNSAQSDYTSFTPSFQSPFSSMLIAILLSPRGLQTMSTVPSETPEPHRIKLPLRVWFPNWQR